MAAKGAGQKKADSSGGGRKKTTGKGGSGKKNSRPEHPLGISITAEDAIVLDRLIRRYGKDGLREAANRFDHGQVRQYLLSAVGRGRRSQDQAGSEEKDQSNGK